MDNKKLEYLYLRACGIDDQGVKILCKKLTTNTSLKGLDLSLNVFKQQGVKHLVEALKQNFTMEYLGLASMNLTISDLQPLLAEFGKIKITPEEATELQQKIKERDAILEKNKKSKGKKEEPVPKVPNMVQDDQGNSFVVKKEHFRSLNIGLNNLGDSAIEELDKLLSRTHVQFNLTIASKVMTKEAAKVLSVKFGERVII